MTENTNNQTEAEKSDVEDKDPDEYGEHVGVKEDTKDEDPDEYGELVSLKKDVEDEDSDK